MMLYELDDIEKEALLGAVVKRARADLNDGKPLTEMRKESALAAMNPRPGEKIQKFWCEGCETWHEGSVLGGPIGDPHGDKE